MEAVHLIRTSTELQFKSISKRLWVECREILELEYDPKIMRKVRRPGASSTSEYSTKSLLEWQSERLDSILEKKFNLIHYSVAQIQQRWCAGGILIPSNRNAILVGLNLR